MINYLIDNNCIEDMAAGVLCIILEAVWDKSSRYNKMFLDALGVSKLWEKWDLCYDSILQQERFINDGNVGKTINLCVDDISLFEFAKSNIACVNGEYIYSNEPIRQQPDYKPIKFSINKSYEIFGLLGECWGDWNACPNAKKMKDTARRWEELFSAEVVGVSHDCMEFRYNKALEDYEVEQLLGEIIEIAPNSMDIYRDKEKLRQSIVEKRAFVLWWN